MIRMYVDVFLNLDTIKLIKHAVISIVTIMYISNVARRMYICRYVCTYVRTYVCMYVHTYVPYVVWVNFMLKVSYTRLHMYVVLINWWHEVAVQNVVDLHLTTSIVISVAIVEMYHEESVHHAVELFLTIITHIFVATVE